MIDCVSPEHRALWIKFARSDQTMWLRKPGNFSDADEVVPVALTRAEYDALPKFDVETPYADLRINGYPKSKTYDTLLLIARCDGKEYLANTEGHTYCRYVTALAVVE